MKNIFRVIAIALSLAYTGISYAQGSVRADSVVDINESRVSYDIGTVEGEDLIITVDYASGLTNLEIENMDVSPRNSIKEGTSVFTILTKEDIPIEIQYSYGSGKPAEIKISTKPPNVSLDEEYSQVLAVESKGGHIINFTFIWQGRDLTEVRIEPLVNPFAA